MVLMAIISRSIDRLSVFSIVASALEPINPLHHGEISLTLIMKFVVLRSPDVHAFPVVAADPLSPAVSILLFNQN